MRAHSPVSWEMLVRVVSGPTLAPYRRTLPPSGPAGWSGTHRPQRLATAFT